VPPPRWVTVGLPLALAGLVAVLLAASLGDRPGARGRPVALPSAGSSVPAPELAGTWTGEGALTRCAGLDDGGCSATRSITLTVDCSRQPCAVTPFRPGYGRPPLRFQDGRYRAAGALPAEVAPTCGGVPTSSALWRLDLVVRGGRLVGSYAESTVQSFDCGATGVAWQVALDRS
jgi:hypothetical protein